MIKQKGQFLVNARTITWPPKNVHISKVTAIEKNKSRCQPIVLSEMLTIILHKPMIDGNLTTFDLHITLLKCQYSSSSNIVVVLSSKPMASHNMFIFSWFCDSVSACEYVCIYLLYICILGSEWNWKGKHTHIHAHIHTDREGKRGRVRKSGQSKARKNQKWLWTGTNW